MFSLSVVSVTQGQPGQKQATLLLTYHQKVGGSWRAQSGEHATLDLRLVRWGATLGVVVT